MSDKVIMGNMLGMPSPRSDWNETNPLKGSFIRNKPDLSKFATKDEIGGGGGSDARVGNLDDLTTTDKSSIVAAINEVNADCDNRNQDLNNLEAMVFQHNDELFEMTKPPETEVPTTLEANTSYNFGLQTELSLSFPTSAKDGDVIYIHFYCYDTPTNLTVDTSNTTDIDLIPEAKMGYEIYAKYDFDLGYWIVKYSEHEIPGV